MGPPPRTAQRCPRWRPSIDARSIIKPLLGRDDLVALGKRLGVTHCEVAVVERHHSGRTRVAARVRINHEVNAAPLTDQQVAPHAEDHGRQARARTLREVRGNLLRNVDREAVQVRHRHTEQSPHVAAPDVP